MESHKPNMNLTYLLCKDIHFVLDKTEFISIIYKKENTDDEQRSRIHSGAGC